MKGFANTTNGSVTPSHESAGQVAYPLDIDLIDIRDTSGFLYKTARFLALPIECLLRVRMGWQYPGAMCWMLMGLSLVTLLSVELSTTSFLFLAVFFFRAAGLQIHALKRARWGADHAISGYSGGESIFARMLFGKASDLQKDIDRQRSIRMFFEPLITLVAGLFLWPEWVGVYLLITAPAMMCKQLREFHYMRRKQQSMHTRQEKVEWWQGLIHGKHGASNATGMASHHTAPISNTPVGDVNAMKAQMPRDLWDFMGGDKEKV